MLRLVEKRKRQEKFPFIATNNWFHENIFFALDSPIFWKSWCEGEEVEIENHEALSFSGKRKTFLMQELLNLIFFENLCNHWEYKDCTL